MADDETSDESFVVEDVETLVKQQLQSTLSEVQYDSERVGTWINTVIDSCLKGLQAMGKSYKYIVTCIIMQKNGAGLHTSAGAFWDGRKDGSFGGAAGARVEGPAAAAAAALREGRRTPTPLPNRAPPCPFAGIVKVPWENASMHCIVTIFGLAIAPSPQPNPPPIVA